MKKLLSLLLALVMCLGMVPTAAMADTTDEPAADEYRLELIDHLSKESTDSVSFDRYTTNKNATNHQVDYKLYKGEAECAAKDYYFEFEVTDGNGGEKEEGIDAVPPKYSNDEGKFYITVWPTTVRKDYKVLVSAYADSSKGTPLVSKELTVIITGSDRKNYEFYAYVPNDDGYKILNNGGTIYADVANNSDGIVDVYYRIDEINVDDTSVEPKAIDSNSYRIEYDNMDSEISYANIYAPGNYVHHRFTISKDAAADKFTIEPKVIQSGVEEHSTTFDIAVRKGSDIYTVRFVDKDEQGNFTPTENSTVTITRPATGKKDDIFYLAVFKNDDTDYIKDDNFAPNMSAMLDTFENGKIIMNVYPYGSDYVSKQGIFMLKITVDEKATTSKFKTRDIFFKAKDDIKDSLGNYSIKSDFAVQITESVPENYEIKFVDEKGAVADTDTFTVERCLVPSEDPDSYGKFGYKVFLNGEVYAMNKANNGKYRVYADLIEGTGIYVDASMIGNDDWTNYFTVTTDADTKLGTYKVRLWLYDGNDRSTANLLATKDVTVTITGEVNYTVNAYKRTENGFVKLGENDALHILKNDSGDTTADIYIQLTDENGKVERLCNNQVRASGYPNVLKVIDSSYVAVDENGNELKADEKGVYVKVTVKVVDTDNTEPGNLGQITFKVELNNKEYHNAQFSYKIYYHEIIDNFDLRLMEWVHNNVYEEACTNEITYEKPAIDSNEKIYFAFFKNDDKNYFNEDYFTFKEIKSPKNAPKVTVCNMNNKKGFFEANMDITPDTKAGKYTYELKFDTTNSGNLVLGECYTVTAKFTVIVKDADYKINRIDTNGEPLTVEKGGESKALIFKVLKDGEDFDVYDNGYILSVDPADCQGFFINDSFEASSESYRAIVTAYLQGIIGEYPVKVQLKKAGNDSVLAENTINVNVIELPDDTPMPKRSDISIEGEYFYTGDSQTVLVNGYMPSKMYVSNGYKDKPGTYNVTVSLKAGYEWADGGTEPVELKWVINKKVLKTPVLTKAVFEYTGEDIDVAKYLTGFDSDIMFTTGTTEANAISGGYYFDLGIKYSDCYTFMVGGKEVSSVRFAWKIVKELTAHEITVTNGTATPAKAKEGELVTVKANVPDDKEFVKWTTETDGVKFANESDKETTFEMPDNDVKIKAELKDKEKYTVTAYGLYGSVMGITPGEVFTAECMENEKVALQIGGRSGYKLKGLTLEGITESDITWYAKEQENDHRGIAFNMPKGNVTVTVNWEKIDSKPSSGGGGGGSAAPSYEVATVNSNNGTTITDKKSAKKGDTVTITVEPKDGYEIDKVTVKDSNGKEIEVKDLGNGKFSFVMPSGKVSINAEYKETAKETDDKPALKFKDVKEEDYFYNAVLWAIENGVTSGITDELFGSGDNCTRAHAITFLWRAMGCPEPENTYGGFTDVIGGSYYEKAVLWAVEKGITSGISDTLFAPDNDLTRAQIVAFLWRLAGCPTAEVKADFTDTAEDGYYIDALNWAVQKGIVYGISENKFEPDVMCSRAQIITFIMRYIEIIK